MIGSHNSFTFLHPRIKILKLFSWLWKCQNKTIGEQYRNNVRYFDLRVRRRNNRWQLCHGIVDLDRDYESLDQLLSIFTSDCIFRVILEKGSVEDETLFCNEITRLSFAFPNLDTACIKKGWKIIKPQQYNLVDYSYVPWHSDWTFWDNIKSFNFFTTIKRWARKHNPVISDITVKSTKIYFMDFI